MCCNCVDLSRAGTSVLDKDTACRLEDRDNAGGIDAGSRPESILLDPVQNVGRSLQVCTKSTEELQTTEVCAQWLPDSPDPNLHGQSSRRNVSGREKWRCIGSELCGDGRKVL